MRTSWPDHRRRTLRRKACAQGDGSHGRMADRVEELEREVRALRDEVAELREELHAFRPQFE